MCTLCRCSNSKRHGPIIIVEAFARKKTAMADLRLMPSPSSHAPRTRSHGNRSCSSLFATHLLSLISHHKTSSQFICASRLLWIWKFHNETRLSLASTDTPSSQFLSLPLYFTTTPTSSPHFLSQNCSLAHSSQPASPIIYVTSIFLRVSQ